MAKKRKARAAQVDAARAERLAKAKERAQARGRALKSAAEREKAAAKRAERKVETTPFEPDGKHTPFSPVPTERMPRFAGVPTFLRLPAVPDGDAVPAVDVLLVGVPLDGGSTYRSGARFGPRAVRDASALARGFSSALGIDVFDELRAADGGDVVLSPFDLDAAIEAVAARAEAIARSGVIGGFIGGDQTLTLGALRGIHRAKLKSVGLVHIDAHSNTAGPAWGRDIHHGSVIRHAVTEGLIRPDWTVQIGLRGPYSTSGDLAFAMGQGFEIVNVDEVKWDLHSAVSTLRKVVRQGPVYVSVDIAALDPAQAPGVGIPWPGGMTAWELQQILRALVGSEIVGFDVVELCPPYDVSEITAHAGVMVVQEILAAMADTRRSARPAPSTRDARGGRISA
ncbi:MAG: arginase family protein [Myxococcales bacterium]|nr:arginase family protein [Myxococcales bacterium]